jgi:hypothetical protein
MRRPKVGQGWSMVVNGGQWWSMVVKGVQNSPEIDDNISEELCKIF